MHHNRPVLAAYISGHGFGHFTRSAAVLEALAGGAAVHVRTSAQALLLARRTPWLASVEEVDVGPGVVQRGPLAVDVGATLAALQQHIARLPALVEAEAGWLARVGARLVFADVPPLAFAAAARAGVPSVGMGNFTWSWIYDAYAHHDRGFSEAAGRLRDLEAQATELLALAGGGGLEHCGSVIEIAPVVRRPTRCREEVRRILGLDSRDGRPVTLVSFGGFAGALTPAGGGAASSAALDLRHAASHNRGLRLLIVSGPPDLQLPHARSIEPDARLGHPDLLAAADCVIGKPGYGTVAECLHRPTAFVHVPRGEFREYPALVALIERWLPQAPLSLEEFVAGRWTDAVERALLSRSPDAPPPGDGIREAAAHLFAHLA